MTHWRPCHRLLLGKQQQEGEQQEEEEQQEGEQQEEEEQQEGEEEEGWSRLTLHGPSGPAVRRGALSSQKPSRSFRAGRGAIPATTMALALVRAAAVGVLRL